MFSSYFILIRSLVIFLLCTLFCLVLSFSSDIVGLLIAAQVSTSICRWFWKCLLRLFVAIGVVVVYPILPYSIFKTIANVKKKLISFRLCVCGFSLLYYFLFMDSSYIKLFITFSYSFDAKLCVCLSTEVHFELMLLPVPFLYSFSANKYNIMDSDNILKIFPPRFWVLVSVFSSKF